MLETSKSVEESEGPSLMSHHQLRQDFHILISHALSHQYSFFVFERTERQSQIRINIQITS